jgi:hypothetical protein
LHEKSLVKNDVIFGYHLVAVPRLKNVLRWHWLWDSSQPFASPYSFSSIHAIGADRREFGAVMYLFPLNLAPPLRTFFDQAHLKLTRFAFPGTHRWKCCCLHFLKRNANPYVPNVGSNTEYVQ